MKLYTALDDIGNEDFGMILFGVFLWTCIAVAIYKLNKATDEADKTRDEVGTRLGNVDLEAFGEIETRLPHTIYSHNFIHEIERCIEEVIGSIKFPTDKKAAIVITYDRDALGDLLEQLGCEIHVDTYKFINDGVEFDEYPSRDCNISKLKDIEITPAAYLSLLDQIKGLKPLLAKLTKLQYNLNQAKNNKNPVRGILLTDGPGTAEDMSETQAHAIQHTFGEIIKLNFMLLEHISDDLSKIGKQIKYHSA